MNKEVLEWIKSIVIAIVLALVIKNFLFYSTLVRGQSMEPTLKNQDRLFTSKLALYSNSFNYGDIISFEAPDLAGRSYVKRVVALPGDRIKIEDGRVFRNEIELEEDYIAEGSYTDTYNESEWLVEDGHLFVIGDNRLPDASNDSRAFGTIDQDLVEGIVSFRYFPLGKSFGKL